MLRSKNIADYFKLELERLTADKTIPFDIHLYFENNAHVMLWKPAGDAPTKDFLEKYHLRGVKHVWVNSADRALVEQYLRDDPQQQATPEDSEALNAQEAPTQALTPVAPPPSPAELAGAAVAEVIQSKNLSTEQKEAIASEVGAEAIAQSTSAETVKEQEQADKAAREMVQALLASNPSQAQEMINDLWNLPEIDPELEHSVTVATYSVLLSLAFGRIDPEILGDIALAGLIHDLGVSQVPFETASKAWNAMSPEEFMQYQAHVNAGAELVESLAQKASERVREISRQHHEKFDGTGYPRKLEGFQFDDIAQLVAMADLACSIRFGHWDGKPRTMRESFQTIEAFEKTKNFPQYFNPEVFSRVLGWINSKEAMAAIPDATDIVQRQREQTVV